MLQQNKWCYCKSSTKAHYLAKTFPKQTQKISEILENEGVKNSPFNEHVAFNIDEIENKIASAEKRNKRGTMDMAFCVIRSKEKKKKAKTKAEKPKAKQALLTELKLRVNNEKNIRANDLKQKIKCTKEILSKDTDIQIHQTHLFIFNEKVKQRAQYRIRNLFKNNPNYKVLDVEEFYQSYFTKP